MFNYKLIRSDRKTISAQVLKDGSILVRAPRICPLTIIEDFLWKKQKILEKYRLEVFAAPQIPQITEAEFEKLRQEAISEILPRVRELSKTTGLAYKGAKITRARQRFGSCSTQNRLCFSAFLVLAGSEEIDYVILHELCHTVHHNHSHRFYDLVSGYMPDWKSREEKLKKIMIPEISG